jgi:hypothetical protein
MMPMVAMMTTVTVPAVMPAVSATTVMATMSAMLAAVAPAAALLRSRTSAGRAERECNCSDDHERQDGLLQTVHGILPKRKTLLVVLIEHTAQPAVLLERKSATIVTTSVENP